MKQEREADTTHPMQMHGDWMIVLDVDTGDIMVFEFGPANRKTRKTAARWAIQTLFDLGYDYDSDRVWRQINRR